MKKYTPINPHREPLSMEKLRALTGWTELSDEQAEQVVRSIELYASILYEAMAQKKSYRIDNQLDVNLKNHSKTL